MKKIEYLFNILLEKNINFEKTFSNEYILNDFYVILSEHDLDKRLKEYFDAGFRSMVYHNGYILASDLQDIILEDLRDYEYFIF